MSAWRTVSEVEGWTAPKGKERGQGPYCIALNADGTQLYIANLLKVHVLDLAAKTSRVVAGNGKKGVPQDGALAVEAPLVDPRRRGRPKRHGVYSGARRQRAASGRQGRPHPHRREFLRS